MKTKNNKNLLLTTSVVCLLPMIFSAVVYAKLPEQIAVQWNNAGNVSNSLPKAVAAFGLPILFLVINLVLTKMRKVGDPTNESQVRATANWNIFVWTAPALSVIMVPITLLIAMGAKIPITMIGSLIVGLILIVTGNYLPKSRQNSFMGIKLPWTQNDENNWNKTHRLAGYVYVICGVLLIAAGFLLKSSMLYIPVYGVVIAVLVLFPTIYSYSLYRKTKT